jgi:hypothetical protein
MQHSLSPMDADTGAGDEAYSHVRLPRHWSILLTSEKLNEGESANLWGVLSVNGTPEYGHAAIGYRLPSFGQMMASPSRFRTLRRAGDAARQTVHESTSTGGGGSLPNAAGPQT